MNKHMNKKLAKLESKVLKLNDKIEAIKSQQKDDDRVQAFNTIMELGKKHNLFKDRTSFVNLTVGETKHTLTIVEPNNSPNPYVDRWNMLNFRS
tara:strand:- start:967 stop:1248 length:282 start_codon:yes stop_codon:yes gene_type:complete